MKYDIAIVGATGLVGRTILKVLEEMNLPIKNILPVASSKSVGKTILFKNQQIEVLSAEEAIQRQPHLAIFSAGGAISTQLAPKFTAHGIKVIDNSSAWRMNDSVPLIVPEINAHILSKDNYLIANPNCSTIQMVVALNPLHKAYNLKHITVSTYQSVTGSGIKGSEQLEAERQGKAPHKVYPHPIDKNALPQGGGFEKNGYSNEELKLIYESRKIMDIPTLEVSPTVVRIPVEGGHSESVSAEFEKKIDMDTVREILNASSGITVQDDPHHEVYPMPLYARGKDDVFVGRLRKDLFSDTKLNMWVVSDNLRKGAATNAVQIAQYLIHQNLV